VAILAALLYDAVRHHNHPLLDIKRLFDVEVADTIAGMVKMSEELNMDKVAKQTESYIKLLLTLGGSIRAILIKLVFRLYDMRHIANIEQQRQERIKKETAMLYAPIAHRLGLYSIKTELEELLMKYNETDMYRFIANKLNETKAKRNQYIRDFIAPIKKTLDEHGIACTVKGRPKSIHSIWRKMKAQNVPFEKVYDLFAIRIILTLDYENIKHEHTECWQVYSLITNFYQPNTNRLRDWISAPKGSGYESLHITVLGTEGRWVEVQIRTQRMDEIAEKGQAAHWKYKESSSGSKNNIDHWLQSIRDQLERPSADGLTTSNEEKAALYSDIFVFTPDKDLKRVDMGATVLDFAFQIHSQVGASCTGARVNGKFANIGHPLQNGDTVEIITSKQQSPKRSWLNIVTSPRAKAKVRKLLKEAEYKYANIGREEVRHKMEQCDVAFTDENIKKVTLHFEFKTQTDLYHAVGSGELDSIKIKDVFAPPEEEKEESLEELLNNQSHKNTPDKAAKKSDFLQIDQQLNQIDFELAKCCNPIPGDEIFAFVTVSKGTKIHKIDCPNALDLQRRHPYRVIKAGWNSPKKRQKFTGSIAISGIDQKVALKKISKLSAIV